MTTSALNQSPYAGSLPPTAAGEPAAGPRDTRPASRAGVTAGTTPTTFDASAPATSGTYLTGSAPMTPPTATDWKRVGATDADIALLRASGLSVNELRSTYEQMYAQSMTASSPGLRGDDPLAGTPLEGTGLLYDAQSGLAIDPKTSDVYDPATGAMLDPQTGAPVTTGADGAAAAPGAGDATPGWNEEYAGRYAEVLGAAGMSPEGVDVMLEQLAADTSLNAAALDAGLEFYASPEGVAQLTQIDGQIHAGVPVSAYLPMIGMGIGAATAAGGIGVGAYRMGERAISSGATRLMERAATGDAAAATRIARHAPDARGGIGRVFDRAGSRAAAMTGVGSNASDLGARARASLQVLYERDPKLRDAVRPGAGATVSTAVDDMIKHGFDAKGNPTGTLATLAQQKQVTRIAGESVESFAVRVAERHGVHMKAPAAAGFLSGVDAKSSFNGGGGTAFRPYDNLSQHGAKYRAAADRFGSVAHPIQRARLVNEARMAGPAMLAKQSGAGAGGRLAAEIASRSTGAATVGGGLKGIGMQSLKATGSKLGIAGLVLGAGFEVPKVIETVKEHGVTSKEAGNAIGGAVGRTAGAATGFAAGAMAGAAIGATVGTFIPVPIVGTLVGGAVGLAVGAGVSYVASKGLGAVGEHAGDAASAVDKFGDKVLGEKTMDVAQNVGKSAAKFVVSPVGAGVEHAVDGAKKLGGGIKKLFGGD